MNKYYKPSLEEFHVNFEYELLEIEGKLISGTPCKYKWVKCSDFSYDLLADDTDTVSELKRRIDDNLIRVKYLDREDIESCGWEASEDLPVVRYDNNNGVLCNERRSPVYELNEKMLVYFEDDHLLEIYHFTTHQIEPIRFRFIGTIKNKSELLVLMKQLSIA